MPEGLLKKVARDVYHPLDDGLDGVKIGGVVKAKTMRERNVKFLRKWFALVNIGFDAWTPDVEEYKGLPVQKNFERFRKDLIIATGNYDLVSNIKGEVRAEAKSIAFGNMSEETFEDLYSKTIDVLLQKILSHYTREDIDRVVEEVLQFS